MRDDDHYFEVNINKYDVARDYLITRASSLNMPSDYSVMFCTTEHMAEASSLGSVKGCLVYWPEEVEIPEGIRSKHVFVRVKDPRQAYAMFFVENSITYLPKPCSYKLINGAYIADGAKIGKGCVLFPNTYIDNEVSIGQNCYIGSGVKLMGRVQVGDGVVIRENTVIGSDGLSTMRRLDGTAATIPQFGGVILEDNVQVGANTVIARGAIDDTVIRSGSKIDNCCFISHNVDVGKNTFIVGETIMFGSSSTGKQAHISGNVTVREGCHIGNGTLVGMGAVVVKDVPDGAVVKGNPAK